MMFFTKYSRPFKKYFIMKTIRIKAFNKGENYSISYPIYPTRDKGMTLASAIFSEKAPPLGTAPKECLNAITHSSQVSEVSARSILLS